MGRDKEIALCLSITRFADSTASRSRSATRLAPELARSTAGTDRWSPPSGPRENAGDWYRAKPLRRACPKDQPFAAVLSRASCRDRQRASQSEVRQRGEPHCG